jgi:hypothetical protein
MKIAFKLKKLFIFIFDNNLQLKCYKKVHLDERQDIYFFCHFLAIFEVALFFEEIEIQSHSQKFTLGRGGAITQFLLKRLVNIVLFENNIIHFENKC